MSPSTVKGKQGMGRHHGQVNRIITYLSEVVSPFEAYMHYTPSDSGHLDGQHGYGYIYISIAKFVDWAIVEAGR